MASFVSGGIADPLAARPGAAARRMAPRPDMRTPWLIKALMSTLALAGSLALTACQPKSSARTEAGSGQTLTPLQYRSRVLPNGLQVFAMPDASTATVSVQVWYKVGSKDDPIRRSGFAHLFEHLMFKSTRNLVPEQFDRLTEDVGGFNNASTADDYTNYYEVVPANHLERILFAEADRMQSLAISQEVFVSERDVVKEEYRQRVLAQPYGKLFGLYATAAAYDVHPYGRPGIGSIEDLDAASIADVRAFHATYYRPDNAILVVSGNFDPARLDSWVDQYFGKIARPDIAIPRVTAVEPKRTTARHFNITEPGVPLPAVLAIYPVPAYSDPDFPALTVLDAILSTGEGSRLYQSLVYDKKLAAQIFTGLDQFEQAGTIRIAAIVSGGKTSAETATAMDAELARLRDSDVTEAELERAKNQLLTGILSGRETSFGRALELANAVTLTGKAEFADQYVKALSAVKIADIRRVAQKWLQDDQRITIDYQAKDEADKNSPSGTTRSDTIKVSDKIVASALPIQDAPPILAASAADRLAPPEAGTPVSAKIPELVDQTLPNGLRLIVGEVRGLPLISVRLVANAGAVNDPKDQAGLANMVADVMTKGTTSMSAPMIAQSIEALGSSLSANAGQDSASLDLVVGTSGVNQALSIMADVARNPAFDIAELERQRQQALDGLSVALETPRDLAGFVMNRLIFGTGPYGGVATPRSIKMITRQNLVDFHANHWLPGQTTLIFVGDISSAEARKLTEQYFGNWTPTPKALNDQPASGSSVADNSAPRAIGVHLPGAGQAVVSYGQRAIRRSDPSYFASVLANSIMGGGFSSRLNAEIRIKRGLSYGAGASFRPYKRDGRVVASAQTKNQSAFEVAALMRTEFANLARNGPRPEEMAARKAALIGDFGRDVETRSGLAEQIADLTVYGIDLKALTQFVADVSNVTPQAVQASAATLFGEQANLVIAGDSTVYLKGKGPKPANLQVRPAATLNLDHADLK